ncbi:hypothetical protein DACRYDRAFT_107416 [Dacryopinax primogenitus]|uniref:Amidohydrolase-related domain-containing protein n=1 Tax=Dacryopinax primogenitus (strain DJM 731) TaxID=1858805 RepID=M5G193_DACPD|nr:uncharacterized protein DACRYDRAFT_107416 [Dacryopinax primogenitus]EJU02499.1 hypothetical protein DACRYDRAFT_107416 [Dacryopinax primogenitus]
MLLICSSIFAPDAKGFVSNQTIEVNESSGLIAQVRSTTAADLKKEGSIDLRGMSVLPGFGDAHVHLFLHPYSEISWNDQVTKQTITERTVRAVNHSKATLMAGFTAVRDLGTEGALDADLALRKCISTPVSLIPGPRYFCVTRAIVSTGSYGPKGELNPSMNGVDGALGADVADGLEECRKAVRRQIGAGADWIKIYADYGFRSRMGAIAPKVAVANRALWAEEEIKMMIDTAHALGVRVAAHASLAESIKVCSRLGVDTIEHGYEADQEALNAMAKHGVIWVPTLGAYYTMRTGGNDWKWKKAQATFRMGLATKGLKIAVGGDTGVFAHGQNCLEMQLMHQHGMPWKDVLHAATVVSWEAMRGMEFHGEDCEKNLKMFAAIASQNEGEKHGDNGVPFGSLKPGFAADIIATAGSLENEFAQAIEPSKIEFVMKGGKVYKWKGQSV